jgi:hypothetical protein
MSTLNSFNNELTEETSSELNNECSFNDYMYEKIIIAKIPNKLKSTSITKLCFDDQTDLKEKTDQTEVIEEEEKEENKLENKLDKHFRKFLLSFDCVFDSERNLWVDTNGKYRDTRWDWKNHNIWKCKYREWVRKHYYNDSVGNIVPITAEQKDTVHKKIYFDKKTGDIVEKELVFDGQEYQTIINEYEDANVNNEYSLTNEDIFDESSKFRENKVCNKCEEEEKKMIEEEQKEKKMMENYKKEKVIQSKILKTISPTLLTLLDDEEDYEELNMNKILWGQPEEVDRLLTHFNIKNDNIPKGLNQYDIIDDKHLDYLNKMETKNVNRTFKKEVHYLNSNNKKNHLPKEDNLPNYEEKKAYFGNPYENKNEVEYFTQDEMLTKYNELDINNLISVLKLAPHESDYWRIPNKNRFQSLKRDIKPSFIEYMFENCYTNSIKSSESEPTDKQKEVYKSIFNDFSDLFSESNTEEWEVSLKKCLKLVLQMKRYNMWLLKLLFKEGVRVNIEDYTHFLQHSPSPSLLKFVEKHLVDENDNTISSEEMKLRMKESLKNKEIINTECETNTEIEKTNTTSTTKCDEKISSSPTSSKIVFNLKWKTGSFECNLLNAHSKLVEENGQFKLEVNLN